MNNPNQPNKRPTGSANRAPNQAQSRQPGQARPQQARPTAARPTGSAQRPTTSRPAGARPTGSTQRPAGNAPQNPHKNKKFKLGKDGILAIIMLFLVVTLAAIIIICCVKAIADTIGKPGGTTEASTTIGSGQTTDPTRDPVYTTPVVGAWNEGYTTVDRLNTAVNEGDLIVVNYMHAYTFPSSINLVQMYGQSGHNTNYVLGNGMTYPDGKEKSLELSRHIVENLTTMLADMKAANPTLTDTRRLMILSGYRTYEKQQTLYENETVDGLTAKPGHSEHHTGLTFDLRINVKGQSEIEYLNDTEQAWILENCAKYGFILRYTDNKQSITGILNEDWHFRYVGVAHATYMNEHNLCLEEYVDFLRENHSYGVNDPLKYTANDTEYTIYYFPKSVEKDVTKVYVPSSGYEISGDNMKGFIVTVTHKSK